MPKNYSFASYPHPKVGNTDVKSFQILALSDSWCPRTEFTFFFFNETFCLETHCGLLQNFMYLHPFVLMNYDLRHPVDKH